MDANNLHTYYLIFCARLERGPGKHGLCAGEMLGVSDPSLAWVGTLTDRDEAERATGQMLNDPRSVAVALYAWSGEDELVHGSHGTLQCAIGAHLTVLSLRERPYRQRKYDCGSSGRYHEVTMGAWQAGTDNVGSMQLGGGNLPRWTPTHIGD